MASNRGSVNKSFSNVAASRSGANIQASEFSGGNLKIVKTDVAPSGEAVSLVRPMANESKTAEAIVSELVGAYDYKKQDVVKATNQDLSAIQQAFGENLANQLLKTYDGSAIETDTQQELIGEKYLAEQIKRAHEYQKKNSVIDRYAHLLYEGDQAYKSNAKDDLKVYTSGSMTNLKPFQQQEFLLAQSKLQPTSSTVLSSSNLASSRTQVQQQQPVQIQVQAASQQASQHASRNASSAQLYSLQEQLRRLQEEKAALERAQQETLVKQRLDQERIALERAQQERLLQERFAQERAQQDALLRQRLEQERLALERAQQQAQQQAAAKQQQQQQQYAAQQQQQQQYAQQQASRQTSHHSSSSTTNMSSSNLKSVQIDAYNDQNFKSLLDQITKPFNVPVDNVTLDAKWPTNDSLAHLADPIVIPAPEPIVISAPDVIRMNDNYAHSNSQSQFRTEVTFYPKNIDQKFYTNFDASQLNVNRK